MADESKPGDRVISRAGNIGTIQPPPYAMPLHHLVTLDDGKTIWILRSILQPYSVAPVQKTNRKSKK